MVRLKKQSLLDGDVENSRLALLITGGASEFVRALAPILLADPRISLIVVTARRFGPAARHYDPAIKLLDGVDLCSDADLIRLRDFVTERTSSTLNLLHCAGFFPGHRQLDEIDLSCARKVLDSNILSLHGLARTFLPIMVHRGGGHILTCGCHTTTQAYPYMGIFSAAKAGLEMLTQSIAHEYGDRGVIANCLALATLDVERERQLKPSGDCANWIKPSQVAEMILNVVSGRLPAMNGNIIHLYNYSHSFYGESFLKRIGRSKT